jgi:hypothetical protein
MELYARPAVEDSSMKLHRGRGFADGVEVHAGDEADVETRDDPRAKARASPRDAAPGDVLGEPEDDGGHPAARVSDLAPGDDITPKKHRAIDDDDASEDAYASYSAARLLEESASPGSSRGSSGGDNSLDHPWTPPTTLRASNSFGAARELHAGEDVSAESPVSADRARLEALLADAVSERETNARAAALLSGFETSTRAIEEMALKFENVVHEKKRVADAFAERRLRASKAAVALAARCMLRDDEKRDALRRWRRFVAQKKDAVVAAKRARTRHALRNARRAVHYWAARAAQTAGGRRLVARRYAMSRATKRVASAMRAWRAAVAQTRLRWARRFRNIEVASRKARVLGTRQTRDALIWWRLWTRVRLGAKKKTAGTGAGAKTGVARGERDGAAFFHQTRFFRAGVKSWFARFRLGGDAGDAFVRSPLGSASKGAEGDSKTRRRGVSSKGAAFAFCGFVLGGRLAHSAAEASARSRHRLAETETARLRRRVDELTARREEEEAKRCDCESAEDATDAFESETHTTSSSQSLEACSSAREADAATLAHTQASLERLTLAMRAAVEDKTRAETEKNDAIETSRSCAASARDDAERRRTTTTLSFASPISSSFPKNARARFLETRYSYELRGVSPDVVASASLFALVSFVIAALVCFALFAFRQRRFQRRVGDELRVARNALQAADASVKRANEKAEALRVELDATTRSKAAAVEEVRRSAARDVESAAAMMARLTALAEKAETSANAHRDENETLASQNAAMKKAVTSLETRLRSAELAVATHEAARERSRRRKEKEKREKKETAAGDETETRTTKQPARLPAHRLAPFERDSTRDSKQAEAEPPAAEAAPPAAAEAEPTPAPAPSPSRASRSVVQRVMGWNKRVEKAGAG